MAELSVFFLFLFGLCVGSFLNVVVYRLNHGQSPFRGRSFCPQCKKKIFWYDNVPLLSFILLKGKCRFCHFPISIQYPIVELATGILIPIAYHQLSIINGNLLVTGCWLLVTGSLIAIFVSDWRYQTIPDEIVYPALAVTVLFHLRSVPQAQHHLGGVLLAGLAAAAFFYLLVLVTRGKGMGMGDVKLAGLMGLLLGFPQILIALFLAFLTGAIIGVILILLGRKRFGEHIPFGPFLTAATAVALFWGKNIWDWYWFRLLGF